MEAQSVTILNTWLDECKTKPKLVKQIVKVLLNRCQTVAQLLHFVSQVLMKLPITLDILKAVGIGKTVKKLSKASEITGKSLLYCLTASTNFAVDSNFSLCCCYCCNPSSQRCAPVCHLAINHYLCDIVMLIPPNSLLKDEEVKKRLTELITKWTALIQPAAIVSADTSQATSGLFSAPALPIIPKKSPPNSIIEGLLYCRATIISFCL